MLNKIFVIFLIFFHFIGLNVYGDEQMSFDVNEIEILDNGNKIIGKNRGIITTDSGITIEADDFEFNKIKNILQAKGNIIIKDKINNYNFAAQNILYKKNEEILKRLQKYYLAFMFLINKKLIKDRTYRPGRSFD